MATRLHPHAQQRLAERGATEAEVLATVPRGSSFPAKLGRTGFRRNFPFGSKWRGKYYANKQVIAYADPRAAWRAGDYRDNKILLI